MASQHAVFHQVPREEAPHTEDTDSAETLSLQQSLVSHSAVSQRMIRMIKVYLTVFLPVAIVSKSAVFARTSASILTHCTHAVFIRTCPGLAAVLSILPTLQGFEWAVE